MQLYKYDYYTQMECNPQHLQPLLTPVTSKLGGGYNENYWLSHQQVNLAHHIPSISIRCYVQEGWSERERQGEGRRFDTIVPPQDGSAGMLRTFIQ